MSSRCSLSSRPKAKVSLCMIVRNEENNLAECLEAVAPLLDEIVIVDTGSTDATKAIAARYTPHVYDFAWCDNFAAARNESLRHATGDWILWLDADDRLSAENIAKLAALLEQLDDRPRSYFMDTVLHYAYECEGTQLLTHERLFRRHADIRWRGRVHEQLSPGPTDLQYETIWINIRIDHLGYQSATLKQRKCQRNVRLLRMDYAVDPDDPNTLLHLAMEEAALGRTATARSLLQRLLDREQTAAVNWKCAYKLLAELALHDGQPEEALTLLARGLARFPLDGTLRFKQAEILFELRRTSAAQAVLEQIIAGPDSCQHFGSPAELRERLAPRKLAEVHMAQGEHDLALPLLQAVLAAFPTDTLAWYALGGIYSFRGDADQLDAVCQRLHQCPEGSYFAGVLLAIWYLDRLVLGPAAELVDWLIAELPQAPLPRMLRCRLLALQGAPLAAHMQACRDVLRLDPANQEAKHMQTVLENTQPVVAASPRSGWQTSVTCDAGAPLVVSLM